ncbi:MAG: ABC transporter ATP-binding protein [Alphaproteobacteria bacterium]|mgnify:CR=1 FL=1
MAGPPLISVRGLRKSYDSPAGTTEVLHGLDFDIMPGEFVAVMGPSGSGKSTMMNILGCLDTQSAGSFHLAGEDVAHMSDDALADLRNRMIGFVFQGFNLLARTSIEDNVALPLVYRREPRARRRATANAILAKVGLAGHARSLPNQISGGQQQRVAIARALVCGPKIVFADEPTGNLDSKTSHEVMGLFTDLCRKEGLTLMVVTHEADIAQFADRLIRLVDGKVDYDGPTRDFFRGQAA